MFLTILCLEYQNFTQDSSLASQPLFVAKYDYKSLTSQTISFKKGDKLYVGNDDDDKDWWFATIKHSGQEVFIPRNYVAKLGSLDAEE